MQDRELPFESVTRPRVAPDGVDRRRLFATAGLAAAGLIGACSAGGEATYRPAGGSVVSPPRRIVRVFDDPLLEAGRLLKEAAEIEHDLMVQYLYAAFSLKPRYAELTGTGAPEATSLLGVAIQEMQHLGAVNALLGELGFAPVLSRHDFPEETTIYPFAFRLEPLSRASLAKYVYCEAPNSALIAHSPEDALFIEKLSVALGSDPRPNHVGSLYDAVIDIVQEVASKTNILADPQHWLTELRRIKGEGEVQHYLFFRGLFESDHAVFRAQSAPGDDIWALATSDPRYPSVNLMIDPTAYPGHPRSIGDASTRRLAWLGDLTYWLTLTLLDLGYRDQAIEPRLAARTLMQGPLFAIARALPRYGTTGLPFDPLSMGANPCASRSGCLHLAERLAHEATKLVQEGEAVRLLLPSDFSLDAFAQVSELIRVWQSQGHA